MKDYPWGKGSPKRTEDYTANDSEKEFTVPTGKVWVVNDIYANLVASATVGNRILRVEIWTSAFKRLFSSVPTGALVASNTGTTRWSRWEIAWGNTAANCPTIGGSTPSVTSYGPLPKILLKAGDVINIKDTAAIDAAADDLSVIIDYVEYDV